MGTIANAKVTHYYNCYNGYFVGCLLSYFFYIFTPVILNKAKDLSAYLELQTGTAV